jgi:hypothetical protein
MTCGGGGESSWKLMAGMIWGGEMLMLFDVVRIELSNFMNI